MEKHHGEKMQLSQRGKDRHTQTRMFPGTEVEEGGKFEEFFSVEKQAKPEILYSSCSLCLTHSISMCVHVCVWFWSIALKGGRERKSSRG